ncbi:MAG: phospholipase D-like domain-containing protein [Clostridiales bacterium]|nr:phospholipase D-like domain-containing protein [Clostridiales bacterium]
MTDQDAGLGGDVIYDQVTFQSKFLQDVAQAKQSVLIFSPFATPRRVQWLAAVLEQYAQKRISVTVVMRSLESLPERSRKSAQIAVERLKSQGCSLVFRSDIHQKYAIIDDRIVWYGSINLLSFGSSQESMMRLVSGSIAHELMKTEAFNENH